MSSIISGFPGIGKSTVFAKFGAERVSDSDSSQFPKDNFPINYLNHIKMMQGKREFVLVSSHEAVREGLREYGMAYALVYPEQGLKDEYLKRYAERGSPSEFIEMMDEKWDAFILGCQQQQGCNHIVLTAGQYLVDVL